MSEIDRLTTELQELEAAQNTATGHHMAVMDIGSSSEESEADSEVQRLSAAIWDKKQELRQAKKRLSSG